MRWLALVLLFLALSGCLAPRLTASDQARLSGRTYVVTGASSGFGRGVALRLGAGGANVVLAARRTELLDEVAAEVRARGGQALVVTTDVTDPAQVERLAAAGADRFGRIDVWINNAAVSAIGHFDRVPVADHGRVIDVALKGVIYGSHAALRRFKRQGHGTLVNIGSVEGKIPVALHSSYTAAKHGVVALGAAIHQELRLAGVRDRIRVATVLPWAADTPFFDHSANYSGRQGRMILLDDPARVVVAIGWVSLHPRKELAVGWKARASVTAHRVAPRLTQRVTADVFAGALADAPPLPPTAGNVHEPVAAGRTVEGGLRERMREERRRRDNSRSARTRSP